MIDRQEETEVLVIGVGTAGFVAAGRQGLRVTLIEATSRQTPLNAEMAIFEYMNGFYNPRRRHSALGWKSPAALNEK